MPKTKLGKLSVGLLGGFVILLVIFFLLIASGQRGGATFFSNLYLAVPFILAGICGVISFVCGMVAIVKTKEHSVLVYISTFIGFFVTLYLFAEIAYPH